MAEDKWPTQAERVSRLREIFFDRLKYRFGLPANVPDGYLAMDFIALSQVFARESDWYRARKILWIALQKWPNNRGLYQQWEAVSPSNSRGVIDQELPSSASDKPREDPYDVRDIIAEVENAVPDRLNGNYHSSGRYSHDFDWSASYDHGGYQDDPP